ncbi:MAG: YcgN family cysteine cluster protein [Pseudomonadota bacterium]
MSKPFWKTKTLAEMTPQEWESLCDGCGRCCLVKLEDEDTGKIHFTNLACKLLDRRTCRCSDYAHRSTRVPDCVRLTPENVGKLNWLPDTCAYRRLARGQTLSWWHPLVSGRKGTVAEAGISVGGQVRSEEGVAEADLGDHLWKLPRAKRPQAS